MWLEKIQLKVAGLRPPQNTTFITLPGLKKGAFTTQVIPPPKKLLGDLGLDWDLGHLGFLTLKQTYFGLMVSQASCAWQCMGTLIIMERDHVYHVKPAKHVICKKYG